MYIIKGDTGIDNSTAVSELCVAVNQPSLGSQPKTVFVYTAINPGQWNTCKTKNNVNTTREGDYEEN